MSNPLFFFIIDKLLYTSHHCLPNLPFAQYNSFENSTIFCRTLKSFEMTTLHILNTRVIEVNLTRPYSPPYCRFTHAPFCTFFIAVYNKHASFDFTGNLIFFVQFIYIDLMVHRSRRRTQTAKQPFAFIRSRCVARHYYQFKYLR